MGNKGLGSVKRKKEGKLIFYEIKPYSQKDWDGNGLISDFHEIPSPIIFHLLKIIRLWRKKLLRYDRYVSLSYELYLAEIGNKLPRQEVKRARKIRKILKHELTLYEKCIKRLLPIDN